MHVDDVLSTLPNNQLKEKMACEKQAGDHDHEYDELSLDEISLLTFELSEIDDFMVWATDDQVTQYPPWDTYKSREDGLNYVGKIATPTPTSGLYVGKTCKAIGSLAVTPDSGNVAARASLGMYWPVSIGAKGSRQGR